jgi:hypothetical protein
MIMHHDQARGKEMHTQERQDPYSNSRNNLIEHKHHNFLLSKSSRVTTARYREEQHTQKQHMHNSSMRMAAAHHIS